MSDNVFKECDVGWGLFECDIQNEEQEGDSYNISQNVALTCGFCGKEEECVELTGQEIEETQARYNKLVFNACPEDYDNFVTKYSFFNGAFCCDPFNEHKKRATARLKVNTLEDYKLNAALIPGKKRCRPCDVRFLREVSNAEVIEGADPDRDEAGGEEDGGGGEGDGGGGVLGVEGEWEEENMSAGEADQADSQGSSLHPWSQNQCLQNVNDAFHLFDVSPIKQCRIKSENYINEKISKLGNKMRETLGVKAPDNEAQGFIDSLKERFDVGTTDDKYRCLTLCPNSWDATKLSKVFGCSRDMAAAALKLRETHGAGSFPGKKRGRKLPEQTRHLVVNFYNDQEMSRCLPGRKDVVVIRHKNGQRETKQKKLLLCNLNEAFCAFSMMQPDVKIGFSMFADLRPKEVVLAG